MEADRDRSSNVDAVDMAINIVSGTKNYSTLIFELTDLEASWQKYPKSTGELARRSVDYDY